ncbi:MAG: hypothetical protein Q9168_005864 [Polycauliona sp. 1 TL-2023]
MDYQAPGGRGCYNSLTKPATAPSAAPRPATTAARKVTSAANAAPRKRRNHVIAAVKSATSHASVPILPEPEEPEELLPEAWAADLVPAEEEEEAKSATNAAKSATSLATALKAVQAVTAVVPDMAEVLVAMAAGMEAVAHSRLATLAADMDTCLAIAPKDRSATIAEKSAI